MYYELKTPKKLPKSGRYIDPYDNQTFYPAPNDTLDTFIERIRSYRDVKGYPEMKDAELRGLVVSILAETTPNRELSTYFREARESIGIAKAVSFAKAVVSEVMSLNNVSVKTRSQRVSKCLDCKFHQTKSTGSSMATTISGAVVKGGIEANTVVPDEDKLGKCGACGCPLINKTKFDTRSVLAGVIPEELGLIVRAYGQQAFDKCWILSNALEDPANKKLLMAKLRHAGADIERIYVEYAAAKAEQSNRQ